MAGIVYGSKIMVAKPDHLGFGELVAIGEFLIGRRGERREIGDGIDHRLTCNGRAVLVPAFERYYRAEVAAGTVAAYCNPTPVDTELVRIRHHPNSRGIAVVHGGWEFVFRRKPVVDRYDNCTRSACDGTTHHIVGIQIADHPSDAVKVDPGWA